MCGITGKVNFNQNELIENYELSSMTDVISHRGPDDSGIFIDKNVGLGFRRLSIIDLETGSQPLKNHNGSVVIVFNGEIYNYLDLKIILEKKGYNFRTKTDTEVILAAYEIYGENCLSMLRGMFAFAIWDSNEKRLFCARDRFGIKPFYYYLDNNKFVFGSEIKSILKAANVNKELSIEAIDSYFAFGYITSDKSIYKSIKKLSPGHFLILSPNNGQKLTIRKYWDVNFDFDLDKSEKEWIEEIQDSFSETVKSHMISDVPIGAFLSGGIDSSSVVAMMALNSDKPIETFSIGFKEEKYNELEFARAVAKKYNCNHHEQIIEPESIGLLPKLVQAYDEPFADSSAIPTYYVSKFAREYVTVVLSGDGGDELFAGYNIYNYFQKIYGNSILSTKLKKIIWGNIYNMIPEHIAGKGLVYYLSKNKEFLGAYLNIWNKPERSKLLRKDLYLNSNDFSQKYKENLLLDNTNTDFITNLQYLDIKTYLVDDILTKVDRVSMQNSLEVRVPILDHKFAEMTFKIPSTLKYNSGEKKYIFKKSLSKHLPENVLSHSKKGFSVPLSVWFKDDLKEYINDVLLSSNAAINEYLEQNYVGKVVNNSFTSKRNFSKRIWSLLFFEEWLKQNS